MSSRPANVQHRDRSPRLRGRAGVEQRKRRLARSKGLCEHCLKEGRARRASVVNHKVPLAHGGLDVDENTENLCRPHDLKVTAEQFGHQHQSRLGACDINGMPTDPDHPWNQ